MQLTPFQSTAYRSIASVTDYGTADSHTYELEEFLDGLYFVASPNKSAQTGWLLCTLANRSEGFAARRKVYFRFLDERGWYVPPGLSGSQIACSTDRMHNIWKMFG